MVRRLLQPKARRSESANGQDSGERSATSSLHQLPPSTLVLRPTNVHHPSRDTTSIPAQQLHLEPGRTRDRAVSPLKVDIPQTTPAKSRKRLPRVLQVVMGVFRATTTRRQKSPKSQTSTQTNTEAGAPANSGHGTHSNQSQASPTIVLQPPSPDFLNLTHDANDSPSPATSSPVESGQFDPENLSPIQSSQTRAFGRRSSFLQKIENALITRSGAYGSARTYAAQAIGSGPLRRRRASSPDMRPKITLDEIREGFLSDRRSVNLDALDCTRRIRKRSGLSETGGYSDVWRAEMNGRVVAVKALRSTHIDQVNDIRMRKRLGRELHVWVSLRHPNVLPLLGFAFVDNGRRPCLISPWCMYGTLQDYLRKYANPDRKLLVRQVAEGLRYLHSQSPPLVHGDLKTMNVLVTEDHYAKISDFGGSKHLGGEKTGLTTAGLSFGTIRYSAPEISRHDSPQTLQSDVYSFAYVALETMTGRYPFWKVQNDSAVIHKVGWEGKTPSTEDYPELKDEALWGLLRRCWMFEPSARPSMIEVCRTLTTLGYGPADPFYDPHHS
ncbi:hypothetical protein FRB90_003545 [Tulasnella sp. 427]|nr:hypothetical protein FRB90_003545 [Tulasnella sp. 427]